MGETVLFWIFASLAVIAALVMVTNKNPVRSALALVITFLSMAAFYVMLSAQFLAAVQVIVYAGAIMVLFLFVIMLLNLGSAVGMVEKPSLQRTLAIALGGILLGVMIAGRALFDIPGNGNVATAAANGTVQTIGETLFNPRLPWLFPFELTSLLLLVAVVGAIVLAKRRTDEETE